MRIERSISDRASDTISDRGLLREIEALERIAAGGVAHVAANGKFPHWPIDRWISVLGFTGVIISGIFFAGVRWSSVEAHIDLLQSSVDDLRRVHMGIEDRIDALADQLTRATENTTTTTTSTRPLPRRKTEPRTPIFEPGLMGSPR